MKPYPVFTTAIALAALVGVSSTRVHADAVTDWSVVFGDAQNASGQMSSGQSRSGAIVHAALFDAINGIVRKYTPYFVTDDPPRGANAAAASVQAAYTTCASLYPAQLALFDAQLAMSLAAIPGQPGNSQSIADGRT